MTKPTMSQFLNKTEMTENKREHKTMTKYKVTVYATREGSAHMNNAETRQYVVEADSIEGARSAAIDAAYKEGGLEHINPRKVEELRQ